MTYKVLRALGTFRRMLCKEAITHFLTLVEKFERSSRASQLFDLCLPMSQIVSEKDICFLNAFGAPIGYPFPLQFKAGQQEYIYESWNKPIRNVGGYEKKLLDLLELQKDYNVIS